jgi:hypothetical protein
MTRLKDADRLIEKLNTFNDRVHGDTHFICGIESAKEIIQNEPTVEAVPLSAVRKAAKKLAYIHQQIDLYGDRPDLHDEEYWLEYLMDEEWKDEEID